MTPLPEARAGGEDRAPIGHLTVVQAGDNVRALEESPQGRGTQGDGVEDTTLGLEEVWQGMVLPVGWRSALEEGPGGARRGKWGEVLTGEQGKTLNVVPTGEQGRSYEAGHGGNKGSRKQKKQGNRLTNANFNRGQRG